ncbi:hypothetical protein ABK040_008074 [Willaertia magna]
MSLVFKNLTTKLFNIKNNNNAKLFQSSLSQKSFRNFNTNNFTFSSSNNNDLSVIDNLIDQFSKEIRELDQQVTDQQVFIQKEQDLANKIMTQMEKLGFPIQNSFLLEMKRFHLLTQCFLRGILMKQPKDYELNLNLYLQHLNLNCSDRIKNTLKIKHEMKDLNDDWFLNFLKVEFKNRKYAIEEFKSIYSFPNTIISYFDNQILSFRKFFTTESKEIQIISGFYLISFYLAGVDIFRNIVLKEFLKENDGHLITFSKALKDLLNRYNMWKDELDMSYKIKDFELLDKDITLQSCVDCLQFLNLLLQSNGNEQSIQQIMGNYYEKQKDNYIFSFIYSIFLYNLNRKQEANIILKQLTLLVKENKILSITTLPINHWFLRTSVNLVDGFKGNQEFIETLKLACNEIQKCPPSILIHPITNTLFDLLICYQLSKDDVTSFNISCKILDEIPYLYSEEKLLFSLRTLLNGGLNLVDKYNFVSSSLLTLFNRGLK